MEVKQNIAICLSLHKRLKKHCKKTGEKIYHAVERYIIDGIIKDHDNGKS